ncbi:MAG: YkgJ family cysteine cluster protein [Pseudomonadota bacterium]
MVKEQKNQELRMAPEHLFEFDCTPGVPCFTQCCGDVTIVLTPYDLLRLKNALGISSSEFLDKYTIVIPIKDRIIPLVVLKMNEGDKRCPFVSSEGCRVYADRPWPCRMFPLDLTDDGAFRVIAEASRCQGLKERKEHKILEWLDLQDIGPYDEMNALFSEVTVPLQARGLDIQNPQIMKMVFMALYNLEKFREFIFKSTFLDRFELEDPSRIDKIKDNDIELLIFSFDWLKFGLIGEKLFWVKDKPSN